MEGAFCQAIETFRDRRYQNLIAGEREPNSPGYTREARLPSRVPEDFVT